MGSRPDDALPRRRGGLPLRPAAALLVAVGLAAATAVTAVAGSHPGVAVTVGAVFSGLVALGSGLLVALDATGLHRDVRRGARVLGAGMVVWGVGQLLLAVATVHGRATFPTLGDSFGVASAPIGTLGLLLALRPRSLRTHWLRMTLDSLLLGGCAALLLWRLAFRSLLFHSGSLLAGSEVVVIVIVEITLVALLLLAWLRDLDRGLLLMLVGMALYAVSDQYTLHTVVGGGVWPWPAAAGWCVAWPLLGAGVLRFRPPAEDLAAEHATRAETRVTVTTTVVSLLVLMGAMALITVDPSIDVVSIALSVLVIAVFAGRELYTGLQRGRLLRGLRRQAYDDPLTGLGNRRAMNERLERLGAHPMGSVLTLDLDGFKEVNDLLGHDRGDDLLVAVADRIRDALPAGCDAYRIGGDEFVVVVPGEAEHGDAVAQDLLADVRRAADALPGTSAVAVSASVGLCRWDVLAGLDGEPDSEDLGRPFDTAAGASAPQELALQVVLRSGVALHAAKASGRDRVESYDGPVAAAHVRGVAVERRLREALAQQCIAVHYQPVVCLDTGRVVGFEALARWTDPLLGPVGPAEFVPVAERTGLVPALGEQVMRRALGDAAALAEVVPDARVAVNVSPVQLRSTSFAQNVRALLRRHAVAPYRLVVEVTESLFVTDDDAGLRQLEQLRLDGVQVAIDDFGSGYSALAYLNRLPASIVKVDQSLTAGVADDARATAVLRSIAELGRVLPMDVAVEGIETAQVHEVVRALGGAFGQGWYYGAAVPVTEVAALVADIETRLAASTTATATPA